MNILVVIPGGTRELGIARLSHDGRSKIYALGAGLLERLGARRSMLFLHADRLPTLGTSQIIRRYFGRNIPMYSSTELGDRNDIPGTKEQIRKYLATRQDEAEIIFLILFQESVLEFVRLFMSELHKEDCFMGLKLEPGQAFLIKLDEGTIEVI